MDLSLNKFRIDVCVDSILDFHPCGSNFLPISLLFSYWFFPVFPYLPSIGFFLLWSTSSEDIPHIPYSQWPTVIPDMDIG